MAAASFDYQNFKQSIMTETQVETFPQLLRDPTKFQYGMQRFAEELLRAGHSSEEIRTALTFTAADVWKKLRGLIRRSPRIEELEHQILMENGVDSIAAIPGDQLERYLPRLREILILDGISPRDLQHLDNSKRWNRLRSISGFVVQHQPIWLKNIILTPHLSASEIANRIMAFITKGMGDPIPRNLNLDHLDEGQNRGLIMCHGNAYEFPVIPDFIPKSVEWVQADNLSEELPDIIADYREVETLRSLGYFQFSVNQYCPTGDYISLLQYFYNLRQITVPGGAMIGHAGLIGVKEMILDGVPTEIAFAIYSELMFQIANFCGCRDVTWWQFKSQSNISEPFEFQGTFSRRAKIMISV